MFQIFIDWSHNSKTTKLTYPCFELIENHLSKIWHPFTDKNTVGIILNTGCTAGDYKEERENLLSIELKIYRVGLSEKKYGGNEFQNLDALGERYHQIIQSRCAKLNLSFFSWLNS